MQMENTKATAGIAGFSAIGVAALLTAAEPATTAIATLIHGAVASNVTNLSAYTLAQSSVKGNIHL